MAHDLMPGDSTGRGQLVFKDVDGGTGTRPVGDRTTELPSPTMLGSCNAVARRKQEAQRRFRSRTKERNLAAHSLLLDVQGRLIKAERRRSQLQSRITFLEEFVFAQCRPSAGPSHVDSAIATEVRSPVKDVFQLTAAV